VTLFELVKLALDELTEQAVAEYGEAADAVILERMKYLSGSYANLANQERKPIDYKDPATRFAYVYMYVAAHGDYIVQILKELRATYGENLFSEGHARISCLGGGPGSDIVAVLKYLSESKTEKVERLTCYLLDKEQAWGDTWLEVGEMLDIAIRLNVNVQPLDVTDPSSWQSQKRFLQSDMFTLSYFVSEVASLDKGGVVSGFWKKLFASIKPGALILYIDNGSEGFNKYIDEISAGAGLECLTLENNVAMRPRNIEQASVIEAYRTKFGGRFPKLKSTVSIRVYRKPS
jgi:hypothetical protein